MLRKLLLVSGLSLLSACASWQPPKEPANSYYCSPNSAIRHRGDVTGAGVNRPAPKYGSCRG